MKLGIYGPSGSGKTFTSLLIAEGLANASGKRVAYIDTERGTDFYAKDVPERTVHPEAFDFDGLYTRSLTEMLREVQKLGNEHGVIVLDSITHAWEAAIAAYGGKQTSAGTIPFHAWGKIKKPYKELVNFLMNCPQHVIICGRQGNEYETDEEDGELKKTGVKMKAEGETPYEPHILIRMEIIREKNGVQSVQALIEKDRTGILAGKIFKQPSFDDLCKPILPLLGETQAQIPTEDETAAVDAAELEKLEREREAESDRLAQKFCARIDLAETVDALKDVGKELTPDVKKRMLPAHVTALRNRYQDRERALGA